MAAKKNHFDVRPPEPKHLLATLNRVFPDFGSDVEAEDGLHAIMLNFAEYFGAHATQVTEKQLRFLGDVLNEAVSVDDNLENAVSTCFLEHLHQLRKLALMRPFLSSQARERLRA